MSSTDRVQRALRAPSAQFVLCLGLMAVAIVVLRLLGVPASTWIGIAVGAVAYKLIVLGLAERSADR